MKKAKVKSQGDWGLHIKTLYRWLDEERQDTCFFGESSTDANDESLLKKIKHAIIETLETYGPRRLSNHLLAEGTNVGRVRVGRIMRGNNIIPKTVKKFKATTNSNCNYPVAENILNRNFNVAAPCTAWVADSTYVATDEGWLYFAAIMDLYSGKIVGWAMNGTMTAHLFVMHLNKR